MDPTHLPLNEIQGNILRGYTLPVLRHFLLGVSSPVGARAALASLAGSDTEVPLRITVASPWTTKPDYCLNVSMTSDGLRALGLAPDVLASFPEEFTAGAAARTQHVDESLDSAQWMASMRADTDGRSPLHTIITLYAVDGPTLDRLSGQLRDIYQKDEGFTLIATLDGADLTQSRVHFGYVDGLSQPQIAGTEGPKHSGPASVPPGEFLLGYPSQFPGLTYPLPTVGDLGRNGTFSAFLVLRQDVRGFERYLEQTGEELGIDKELIAAKMCGRWRTGVPLSLSPDSSAPDPPIGDQQLNMFDYVPTADHPDTYDDTRGFRCPAGAHIRRTNPRSDDIAGQVRPKTVINGRQVSISDGLSRRRIIRRAMPYGPEFDPGKPVDPLTPEPERGLLLNILCVSLKDQFEFMMHEWVNGTTFSGRVDGKDALIGSNDNGTGFFTFPVENPGARPTKVTVQGFSRFVTIQGIAYTFIPSITGLRYLSAL